MAKPINLHTTYNQVILFNEVNHKQQGKHDMADEVEMIDARKAAQIARDELLSLIPEAKEILLEEVEVNRESSHPYWHITLSFVYNLDNLQSKVDEEFLYMSSGGRQFKSFTVDALTGEVLAMKIRTL